MRDRAKSRMRRTGRAGLMMLALTLSAGCEMRGGSETETERSICRELRADLPSWSSLDTAASLASGARFVAVFEGVCKR